MPLIKGKSEKSFSKNVATEMHAGKPQNQSLAIAYSMKRKAQQKKAMGGHVHDEHCAEGCMMAEGGQTLGTRINYPGSPQPMPSPAPKGYAMGGSIQHEEKVTGYLDHEGNFVRENYGAAAESGKDLNQHEVMPEDSGKYGEVDAEMHEHEKSFSGLDRLAHGGQVDTEHQDHHDEKDSLLHHDLVNKIMAKRKAYSEGGKVANGGDDDLDKMADGSPNNFDDLALRDDLSSSYGEDNNAGDSNGNEQEDSDQADIVARIMRQRKMKQHNPRPA